VGGYASRYEGSRLKSWTFNRFIRMVKQKIDVANGNPMEVDLGGEWILGAHTNMLQLVDRLGLKTYTCSYKEGDLQVRMEPRCPTLSFIKWVSI
jgi:hypothetical protein